MQEFRTHVSSSQYTKFKINTSASKAWETITLHTETLFSYNREKQIKFDLEENSKNKK